jgi:hypothetical protein
MRIKQWTDGLGGVIQIGDNVLEFAADVVILNGKRLNTCLADQRIDDLYKLYYCYDKSGGYCVYVWRKRESQGSEDDPVADLILRVKHKLCSGWVIDSYTS